MKNTSNIRCLLFLLIFSVFAATPVWAQAPRIDKIDPPGWWAGLPDPMLLVHGEHLKDAKVRIDGRGVTLARTQFSDNGHWAFLWLRTADAAAQTLNITLDNGQGTAQQKFALQQRSNPDAHKGFSSADALYLIMTDRFADGNTANDQPGYDRAAARGWHGGDFAGIEKHLDYLQQLGVTALWTTPVASNGNMPESYHGYAATDLYAVDSHFGTLADYRHLSDALHARGMKLVIDLVPNHLGVQHPWIADPPAPEWLHGTLEHHSHAQSEFENLLDPHAPKQAWRDITAGWFTDGMPDLNQENPLVSKYLIQNAMWWIETAGLDGIRLDTFPYVGRAFWHDFHAALHEAYPHLTTVGEVFNADVEITSYFAGGRTHQGIDTGLDTPFDFPVYFTLRSVLTQDKPMTDLARVLRQDSLYPHPERLTPFIGNHDTSRFLTAANGSVPKLKLALGLLTTLRGMPQIYSGDEIAMEGGNDPDNRHDFPGGFPGDKQDAFTKAGRTAMQQDVFAWTSGLLAARKQHAALQHGIQQDLLANDNVFVYLRAENDAACTADHKQDRIVVVANKAAEAQGVEVTLKDTALEGCSEFRPLAPTAGPSVTAKDGKLQLQEPAESITLYVAR